MAEHTILVRAIKVRILGREPHCAWDRSLSNSLHISADERLDVSRLVRLRIEMREQVAFVG